MAFDGIIDMSKEMDYNFGLRSALYILKGMIICLNSDFIGIEDKENRFQKHHKGISLGLTFIKAYV